MANPCYKHSSTCYSSKFYPGDGQNGHTSKHTTVIALVSVGLFVLIITLMSWSYRKHPKIQRRLDTLRYGNALAPPTYPTEHETSERPVHPPKSAKRITMTLEEIDEAAPSLSIQRTHQTLSQRFTTPISKPKPAMTAPSRSHEIELPSAVDPRTDFTSLPAFNSTELTCPICIDTITDTHFARKIQACGHVFHADCLIRWLSSYQANCPLCKCELHSLTLSDSAPV